MYLKTIELNGFKSFPDKTVLNFNDGITAIVGPNGSGKSNISDAIRWVLGEIKPKTLRAPGMQDVIFSGTQKRAPMNYAQVTIVIDNSDKGLKIDFEEVAVTRKIFRGGDSEYYINGVPCRMKDITELFMDTGLGKDGYSVVGQGKTDEIISGRPQDRRNFFEEAAGISKYRHKKEEAERKLLQTEENLTRLNDIIGELETRLPSLKRASGKAMQYEGVVSDLKAAQLSVWCSEITKNREKKEALQKEIDEIAEKINASKGTIKELTDKSMSLSQKRREADLLTDELYKKEKDCEFNISAFQNQIRLYEQEISGNENLSEQMKNEIENDEKKLKRYNILAEEREKKIESLKETKRLTEKETEKFGGILNEIKEKENTAEMLLKKKKELEKERTELLIEKNTKEGKAAYLSELEQNYEGYQKSVKEIFGAIKNKKISGVTVYGTLSDIIKADKKTALAFDAVLGGSLQNIVVENEDDAKIIIEFLKKNSLGRSTFLPRGKIAVQNFDFKGALKEKGVLGKTVDLLKYDKKFEGIITSLLGKTLLVDTYENGAYISQKYKSEFRIVTLSGEVFRIGGAIVGGNILKQTGFMSKNAEIDAIRREAFEISGKICETEKKITDISAKADRLLKETAETKNSLTELNEKKAYLSFITQSIYDETENQKAMLKERDEYQQQLSEKRKKIEELADRNESLLEDIEFKNEQIKQEKEHLLQFSEEGEEIKKKKEEIETEFHKHQEEQTAAHEKLTELESLKTQTLSDKETVENKIADFSEEMWEQYELSFSDAMEAVGEISEDISEMKKKVTALKNKLKNIGAVNVDAIKEYEEVNNRFTFLSTQKNDLENAKSSLNGLIDDMQKIMRKEFKEKFEIITERFRDTFRELFGGGTANLRLSDPNNILESGIEIEVQPPGKKLENLSLLSGGEKAFTATALLFAVLSLNPLPFCIFDEIEAALDEVNVYRFSDYIKKYKEKTQFILISHRRGTMENADTLYGVTMPEKGISKIVSLRVNDVIKD